MDVEKTLELLVTTVTAMDRNINARFDNLETRMDRMETRMDRMETRMDRMEEDIRVLKTDVAVLKTDVAELKTDVAVLKTDVAELKTDVTVLKADVGGLKMSNETRVYPALQAIGESWPGVVDDVREVKRHVEILTDIQEVQAEALHSQAVKLKILGKKTESPR